tara:strand:+ start:2253 stop:4670 length:2418 start_codon:yes stop_codon:yes gene_type:complete
MNILKCDFIGEALQINKTLVFLLLMPLMILGQDIDQIKDAKTSVKELELMSDEELKGYWSEAEKKGYTLSQIKTLARAQGASESDLVEFEKRISQLKIGAEATDDPLTGFRDGISSLFGLSEENKTVENGNQPANIGVFGSSFFNNPKISPAPDLNIATPDSYELGPGDELSISIWGAAENEYNSIISREGYLKIERIGPVYLSGLSISEAKIKLKNKLSKIYSGLNSSYNKVFFDLTLLNSRSIIVNITGSVIAPGTYTLSSLTSILNVLYAAGGPNENGSFREIKIIRNGKEVYKADLYNYFVKGAVKRFSLRDQDVILVPTYKKRVFLNGEFKTNGIFELLDNETISDLMSFNGGIASFGTKDEVYIKRIDGVFRRIETVSKESFKDFILNDGDVIEARRVGDEIKNAVSIEGAIMIPGLYELSKNTTVRELIQSAGGFKESALKERAYLIRELDGFKQEVISIDLSSSMSLDKTYSLKNNDQLIIASIEELSSEKQIRITGEINVPGVYPFFNGATVADLILMAKGITDKGSSNGITIYRSTYDSTQKNPVNQILVDLSEGLKSLKSDQNIKLRVNDLVVVRSKLGYQLKEYVTVKGLVQNEGDYALKNNNYSIYNLIEDFGGFLPDAELTGVKIRRLVDLETIGSVVDDSLLVDINEYIEFGVNINKILQSEGKLDQYNLVLKNGDEIVVPRFDNSIEVSGEVQQSTALSYYRGLTTLSAINKAGGFKSGAKKSKVYVIYQNGNMVGTKSFMFFKKYPKLLPGSKIFVPKKTESSNKTNVGEIVGYTTSLVSIIALIKSL